MSIFSRCFSDIMHCFTIFLVLLYCFEYLTVTSNGFSKANSLQSRGTNPGCRAVPIMVCVLPVALCPYASTHADDPPITLATTSRPMVSNTCIHIYKMFLFFLYELMVLAWSMAAKWFKWTRGPKSISIPLVNALSVSYSVGPCPKHVGTAMLLSIISNITLLS